MAKLRHGPFQFIEVCFMYLHHLYVRNFRSLTELSMEFTKGANLIVGPNAVGKTTVLEAIRLAKAVLAPRTQQETRQVMIQLSATSAQLPQMFNFAAIAKDATKPIEIRCTFQLIETELSSLNGFTEDICSRIAAAQAGISMESGPFALVQFLSSPVGQQIVNALRPQVGDYTDRLKKKQQCELVLIMDPGKGIRGGDIYAQTLMQALENGLNPSRTRFTYFPADRALPHGEVPIQLGAPDAAQQLESHNSNPAMKYQRLKNTIFTWITETEGGKAVLDREFSKIFAKLLRHREMAGFGVNQYGQASILIKDKETGELFDIDAMSSGEKGLILTLLVIARSVEPGGIILLDEPELHLNPAVTKLLLNFLVDEYLRPKDLQAIICSHSPEILGTAMRSDECSVYHLRRGAIASKIRKRDQPEVARALRLLGTSEVEEMLYDGTVFVEGEDDVELLEEAFPQSLARIKFKDLSGRGEVEKQITRLQQAEKDGQKENISYFIFDHDRQPTKLSSTPKVRVRQWDRYCIENYLLEPDILFDIIAAEKTKTFPATLGDAEQLFRRLVSKQLHQLTAREVYKEYGYADPWDKEVAREVQKSNDFQDAATVLFGRLDLIRKQAQSLEKKQWQADFVAKCNKILGKREREWHATWQTVCSGKKFFKDLYSECGIRHDPLALKRKILKECKYRQATSWKELEKTFTEFVLECATAGA
jgi:predicted ATPase